MNFRSSHNVWDDRLVIGKGKKGWVGVGMGVKGMSKIFVVYILTSSYPILGYHIVDLTRYYWGGAANVEKAFKG